MLILSVVRPSLEYGNKIWDCSRSQASKCASESIILSEIFGCSSRTCNEAVRGDVGLDMLT